MELMFVSIMGNNKNGYSKEQEAAELLIRAHDGDCALLYIWQKQRNSNDPEAAARDLCFTLSQIRAANEKLQRMGLSAAGNNPSEEAPAKSISVSPLPNAAIAAETKPNMEEFPEYSSEEISRLAEEDPAFRALKARLELVLGTVPKRQDLCKLLGIYHQLKLSADVLFVLLNYCAEISRGSSGSELKPTMNFIERQAYIWANRGITCVEDAEAYAENQKTLKSAKGRIKRILEINDRKLTNNEERMIESWLTLGFEEEAIRIAYERTVEKTGQRSLPYMDKILLRWNESGIHTISEIRQKDAPPNRSRKNGAAKTGNAFDPGAIDNINIIKG